MLKPIKDYHVIGLMSGTSLDGLDIAYCKFTVENHLWKFKILSANTIDYPPDILSKLQAITALPALELAVADHELGMWIGMQVQEFIARQKLKVDFIASHGHTVFHQPEKGLTLQIGNLTNIYQQTGLPVIGDFRSLDVALGGQGAPLVPIGDLLLFNNYKWCLNLGGISNISFDHNGQRIAFDICPVNIILNYLARQRSQPYDKDGNLASKGSVHHELLEKLEKLDYYQSFGPKSLGIEWINAHILPLIDQYSISIEDKLATFCVHIALQIKKTIEHYPLNNTSDKMLITGGGAFNVYLIQIIKEILKNQVQCELPDSEIISYKEALIFAFLGVLKKRQEVNVLASVTGASCNSSSGIIIDNTILNH